MKHSILKTILLYALFLSTETGGAQCVYHTANTGSDNDVTFTLSGASFQSYGCAPIDPNYWVVGSGATMLATFATPQHFPSFRVWGMNDDDSASVLVDGVSYSLNSNSAAYDAKVVCGQSPGPNGVAFANGKLVGANTNGDGNYSYQNVTINSGTVTSITVTGVSGAGWGFAGVSTNCATTDVPTIEVTRINLFPNPAMGIIIFEGLKQGAEISIINALGMYVKRIKLTTNDLDISDLATGIYSVWIQTGNLVISKRLVKL